MIGRWSDHGMLQSVENVILGMTEAATATSFPDRDTARWETLAARAIAL